MKTTILSIIVTGLLNHSLIAYADCALGSYVSVIQQGTNSHIGSPTTDMGCQNTPSTARNNINPTNPNNAPRDIVIKPYVAPTATAPLVSTTTPPTVTPPAQSLTGASPSQTVINLPATQPTITAPPQPVVSPAMITTPSQPPVETVVAPMPTPPAPPPTQPLVTQPSLVTPPSHTHTVTLPEPAVISAPVGLSGSTPPGADKNKSEGGRDANTKTD